MATKKPNKSLVTFDTSIFALVKKEGKMFLVDPKAEESLLRWHDFMAQVEAVHKQVKNDLKEKMSEMNTLRIDGKKVRVTMQEFGSKYEVTNPQLAVDQGFATEKISHSIDSRAVDKHVGNNDGQTPDGIAKKDRTLSTVIRPIKQK